MPTLPDLGTLLVRTDFTDDANWDQVRDEATREYGPDGFRAYVEPVSDPGWAGAAWEAVKAAAPAGDTGPSVLFIADSVTFASPAHPVLVVDLQDKFLSVTEFPEIAGRTPFRCLPSALWDVENNLNIANVDWEDYVGLVDGGVYRGFELPPPPAAEEKAEAERQARLAEQRQQERTRLAAASPGSQRSIARWAARRACEVAGIADLDWPVFHGDPRVARATVVSLDGRIPNLLRAAMAVPALFDATEPDPLDAALQALYAAAVTFGRDAYPDLLAQLRRAFSAPGTIG